MTPEARRCPRCAVPNTMRLLDGRSLCCNCKLQWRPCRTIVYRDHAAVASFTPYAFTPSEQARLAIYRAAVVAGFYNDDVDDDD